MDFIKLFPNSDITVNVFISDMNEFSLVDSCKVLVKCLFDKVNEYLKNYYLIHYELQSIEINCDSCNIHLIEF